MAVTNLGRVCPVPKGVYDADTEYTSLDIVTYVGSGYMCKATTTGNLPTDTDYWILLSAGSADGLMALVYPIGIIIELAVSTNPATLFGFGTWVAHGTGKVTVGIDTGDTDFDTLGETGGSKTHLHDGSGLVANIAHIISSTASYYKSKAGNWTSNLVGTFSGNTTSSTTSRTNGTEVSGNTGLSSGLPPYIVVYRWERTA